MTGRDHMVMYPTNGDHGQPQRLAAFGDFTPPGDQPADVATGLVSLGFIGAAIKRSAAFLCALAVVGFLVGVGYYVAFPPAYKASTSVLLTYGPDESPASAIFDNQVIAESHTVALSALKKLGLQQSLGSFAASYSVAVITDRVLKITASAPSSAEAVSNANAIAAAFLKFRVAEAEAAQKVLVSSLQNELSHDRQQVADLNSQVSRTSAQPSSSAQQAKLKGLQDQQKQAVINLSVLQQTIAGNKAGTTTISSVAGSVVLDPATPLAHSKLKALVTYVAYGLIGALAIGIGIVVVRAVTSDKLRRRDDIARALGTPVKLSVGRVRLSRWPLPGRRARKDRDDVYVQRIVAHLREAVPTREQRPTLAVVAVDDPGVAALALVSLATSYAAEGREVVLADLAHGAPAATLLGGSEPGVRVVNSQQTQLTLAVPRGDLAATGPIGRRQADEQQSEFTREVASAYASADILLTLVTPDPALGADHLATWAASAVALVSAGRSSWTRVQAVGELVRLGGLSLLSAVLVGADKSDSTLGTASDTDALLGTGRPG